jgi:hypothetical protein
MPLRYSQQIVVEACQKTFSLFLCLKNEPCLFFYLSQNWIFFAGQAQEVVFSAGR